MKIFPRTKLALEKPYRAPVIRTVLQETRNDGNADDRALGCGMLGGGAALIGTMIGCMFDPTLPLWSLSLTVPAAAAGASVGAVGSSVRKRVWRTDDPLKGDPECRALIQKKNDLLTAIDEDHNLRSEVHAEIDSAKTQLNTAIAALEEPGGNTELAKAKVEAAKAHYEAVTERLKAPLDQIHQRGPVLQSKVKDIDARLVARYAELKTERVVRRTEAAARKTRKWTKP